MSSAIVRKAIEIVETEKVERADSVKNSKSINVRIDVLNRGKKRHASYRRSLGDSRSEAALEVESAKRLALRGSDSYPENLKKLMSLSSFKSLDSKKAEKIFERTVKRRHLTEDISSDVQSSAFSEEDFKKFEEEYFVS